MCGRYHRNNNSQITINHGENVMIHIAIVEDETEASEQLKKYLYRFGKENNETFQIHVFADGFQFLTKYQAVYDIIFMDIEMPLMDGMNVAYKLREIDQTSILIFVTNLTQYAIKGYEVDAMDYILKPVNYAAFSMKIRKAILKCKPQSALKLRISTKTEDICFSLSSLIYIESHGHQICYHTEQGDYEAYGTLKAVEEKLPGEHFFRCNSGIIVNLNFVSGYNGLDVVLGTIHLPISRARKKEFTKAFHQYFISTGRI